MGGPCDLWTQTRARPWRAESTCACTQQTVRSLLWPRAPTATGVKLGALLQATPRLQVATMVLDLDRKQIISLRVFCFRSPPASPETVPRDNVLPSVSWLSPSSPTARGDGGKAGRHMCRLGSQGPGLDVSPASGQSVPCTWGCSPTVTLYAGYPCGHPVVFCGSFGHCPGLPSLVSPPLRVHPDQKPSPHSCSPQREQPPICPSLHGSVWLCTPWGACPRIQLVPGSSVPPEPRGLW